MRIARIDPHGFGALAPEPTDLPGGLVVICGPNEAGKSSRMDLVRFVLFGDKALGESKRLPVGGTRRSGSVDLIADDGRVLRVTRTERERVVIDGDGRPVAPAELDALIGDARGEIFKAVQTFDSDSISSAKLLQTAEVRENLLMSALLGSGESATATIGELGKRADALYARGAKTQDRPYSQRLEALRRAREARTEAKAGQEGYLQLQRRVDDAEAAVAAARAARDQAADERDRLDADLRLQLVVRELVELEAAAPPEVEAAPQELVEQARAIELGVAAARTHLDAVRRSDERRAVLHSEIASTRSALGLEAQSRLPDLGGVGTLTAAAAAVHAAEQASDEARRRLEQAQAARDGAMHQERAASAESAPRRGIGLIGYAVIAIGLALAVGGLLTASRPIGIVGALIAMGGVLLTLLRTSAAAPALPPSLDAMVAECAAARDAAAAAVAAAADGWVDAVAAQGLAPGLAVGQLDEVREQLRRLGATSEAVAAAEADRAVHEEPLARFLADAADFLERRGEPVPVDPELVIAATVRETEQVAAAAAAATSRIAAETEHRTQLRHLQALVDEAGGAAAVERVQAVDPAELERGRREAVDAIADADALLEAAIDERGEARRVLALAQGSGDIPAAEQAVESAIEDLREVADRWLAVELAGAVVAEARDDAIRERQRPVTERAAALVGPATGGYWTDLMIGDGDDEPVAVGPGRALGFSELSKGAAAIVYLCLRIGLVEAFGRTLPEPLPVVMDDTLTHLDDDRRRGVAEAIASLARTHQVLYFTCHQEHVDALVAADPAATVIAVDRFA